MQIYMMGDMVDAEFARRGRRKGRLSFRKRKGIKINKAGAAAALGLTALGARYGVAAAKGGGMKGVRSAMASDLARAKYAGGLAGDVIARRGHQLRGKR